jgi:glucosylceramidase
MFRIYAASLVVGVVGLGGCSGSGGETVGASESAIVPNVATAVRSWITSDPRNAFVVQPTRAWTTPGTGIGTLTIEDSAQRQEVDGFGAALTDASAAIMQFNMTGPARDALIEKLVSATSGLGLGVIRLPIAASDSTWDGPYSYDDWGNTHEGDETLSHFGVGHDQHYIIPILKKMLAENTDIHVIATPWSPPAWMKDKSGGKDGMTGGTLKSEYRTAYAKYFADFVRAYWEAGIPIYAVTPQNEPGEAATYPSMTLEPGDEATFVSQFLRPQLDTAHFGWVKIFGYDHNWNNPYPDELLDALESANATTDLDGMAFHCYGSDPEANAEAMSSLHAESRMTGKDIYVTECDRSQTPSGMNAGHDEGIQKLIYAMNNWSRSYLAWQIVLHPDGTPNQGGGCMHTDAEGNVVWHCVGVVSVDTDGKQTDEWDYAYLGHASKFVSRGAHVIPLPRLGSVDSVGFINPNGEHVLVAYNAATTEEKVEVVWNGQAFLADIPARSAATYVW